MNRPHLLRVGNQMINLDHVTRVQFVRGTPERPDIPRDMLYLDCGNESRWTLHDDEARAAWRVLKSVCPWGECDPPSTPEEAAGEKRLELAAINAIARLRSIAEAVGRRVDAPGIVLDITDTAKLLELSVTQ